MQKSKCGHRRFGRNWPKGAGPLRGEVVGKADKYYRIDFVLALVRLGVSKDELKRLDGAKQMPGMPVEAIIRTADRTGAVLPHEAAPRSGTASVSREMNARRLFCRGHTAKRYRPVRRRCIPAREARLVRELRSVHAVSGAPIAVQDVLKCRSASRKPVDCRIVPEGAEPSSTR